MVLLRVSEPPDSPFPSEYLSLSLLSYEDMQERASNNKPVARPLLHPVQHQHHHVRGRHHHPGTDARHCKGSFINQLNFDVDNFWRDFVLLAVLAVAFRLIAFLALLSKTYRKK